MLHRSARNGLFSELQQINLYHVYH